MPQLPLQKYLRLSLALAPALLTLGSSLASAAPDPSTTATTTETTQSNVTTPQAATSAEPANPAPDSVTQLPPIIVTGTANPLGVYGPPPTTSIGGMPAPIQQLPYTVNTVTDQFISDISARRTRDIVGYIPGVNASEDSGGTGDLLNIRGFDFSQQIYTNGMRNRVSNENSRTLDNVQRIEIFKGPGGVEFGAGDPGGFVNYVTKKPQAIASYTAGTEYGSYDYYHGYFDATGPIWTPDNATSDTPEDAAKRFDPYQPTQLGLYYRFIGSGDTADSFRNNFHTDGALATPSVLWNYAEGSSVLLELEYQHRNQPFDRGIMYLEGANFAGNFAPIESSYNQAGDSNVSENTRSSLYWTHKVNDNIMLRLTSEFDSANVSGTGVRNPATFILYNNEDFDNTWNHFWLVPRTSQNFATSNYSYGTKPEVLFNFDTGSVKHTGLLGFNYLKTYTAVASRSGFDYVPTDFNGQPNPGNPNPGINPNLFPKRDQRFNDQLEEYGVYYQHKVDFYDDRAHLLAGVRYDWYEDHSANSLNVNAAPLRTLADYTDAEFSFRVGGVYDVTKNISIYAGYSESYQPQDGLLLNGGNAPALAAQSIEAGIKSTVLQDSLYSTLAVYRTTREHVLEGNPNDPSGITVIPVGTVRVEGVEWELTGKPTRDIDLQGGVSFQSSEITETDDANTLGKNFYNVPQMQLGMRAKYDTSRWLVDGLSFGFGAMYMGWRYGDNQNSFKLPAYYRLDAGVYYKWQNWNFKATVENVLDNTYYQASQGFPDIITPGAPREFTVGAQVSF